jgi:hypothetical protein
MRVGDRSAASSHSCPAMRGRTRSNGGGGSFAAIGRQLAAIERGVASLAVGGGTAAVQAEGVGVPVSEIVLIAVDGAWTFLITGVSLCYLSVQVSTGKIIIKKTKVKNIS